MGRVATPHTFQPLDHVFTASGTWLSRAILWAERDKGEPKSEASHVAVITTEGLLKDVYCIEALHKVRHHRLWDKYGGSGQRMTIYRPLNIGRIERDRILTRLLKREGQRYGYSKLALHLMYKLTGDRRWIELAFIDQWPICSYLLAVEMEREGYNYGVEGRTADPDVMLDFCQAHPDKYECLRPWAPV